MALIQGVLLSKDVLQEEVFEAVGKDNDGSHKDQDNSITSKLVRRVGNNHHDHALRSVVIECRSGSPSRIRRNNHQG